MSEDPHHCHLCWLQDIDKEHEELWSFGEFWENTSKKEDIHWYCEKHFKEIETNYDMSGNAK